MSNNFLHGALVLSAAGLISKLLGAFYRIPLARMIGGEGMGLYQMAYPIYTIILAVSTAGIPVAISMLVAEKEARGDEEGRRRVFRVALGLLAVTGVFFSLFLFQSSYFLAGRILVEERAFLPIVAISPAIFLTAVMSAFRGYFQGQQQMMPTAVSQVVEQLVRVTTVLAAAYLFYPYGVEFQAAGATFGAVTGSTAGLIVLVWLYFRHRAKSRLKKRSRRRSADSISSITKRIVHIALPLSLGGLVMPLTQMVDAIIVPLRLQHAGLSSLAATEMFGYLAGMATTLINLPTIITVSLAMSLVPAISEARAKGDGVSVGRRIGQAIRIAVLLGLPAAVGLAVLARPISVLLYDAPQVGEPLLILAPAALVLGLYQTTSGALQGLEKTYLPVKNLIFGVALKILLNIYLTALPQLNIRGAALATVMGFTLALGLNLVNLTTVVKLRYDWFNGLWKPLAATGLMGGGTWWTYTGLLGIMGGNLATVAAVIVGVLSYGLVLLLTGAIKKEDLQYIPGAAKISKFIPF